MRGRDKGGLVAKDTVSPWNTNRCADCEQDSAVVWMGTVAVHHYGADESKWRVCLNSRRFRDDIPKSKAIPDETATTEQMFFEEPVFAYEGQKLTAQMRPSGLIEITAPVAKKPPVPEEAAGLILVQKNQNYDPLQVTATSTVRREKFNFAQGLELTRRPDKNGR